MRHMYQVDGTYRMLAGLATLRDAMYDQTCDDSAYSLLSTAYFDLLSDFVTKNRAFVREEAANG